MITPIRLSGTAVRAVAVALPASLLVIFAGLLVVFGLFARKEGREYALGAAKVLIELAEVLVGIAIAPSETPADKPPLRPLPSPRCEPADTA
jgi:hypothetical protein